MAVISPWSFLGGPRLIALAERTGVAVDVRPIDLTRVYKATGGLPLQQRAPARQAYRLVEMKRWRTHLGIPLVLDPAAFPVDERLAAACVLAVRAQGGDALGLATALGGALWLEDRDLSDRQTVADVLTRRGVDAQALLSEVETNADHWEAERQALTDAAIADGIFGVPTYIIGGEPFWGQDRLGFVAAALGTTLPDDAPVVR